MQNANKIKKLKFAYPTLRTDSLFNLPAADSIIKIPMAKMKVPFLYGLSVSQKIQNK
jgi:hypothetical protein